MLCYFRTLLVFLLLLISFACSNTLEQTSDKAKELKKLFTVLENENTFNGAVLVAEKGEVLIRKTIGFSDFKNEQALTVNSAFDIASVSKTFTSVAINILVEQGKVNLDDKLTKYFPKLPYDNITVRGLLNHTSGLYDVSGDRELRKNFIVFYNKTEPPYTNKDYLEFMEKYKPPLLSKPGEKFSYSNTGFVLLGMIIEKVSGQGYDEFLSENIFEPAGMNNTFVFSKMEEGSVPNFVRGHQYDSENGVTPVPAPHAPPRIYGLTFGDDDIASTVDDMFAYDQALRTGKLLKLETLQQLVSPPKLINGEKTNYGLGFNVKLINGLRYVSHGGGTAGFWTYCKFSRPENDNTVILMTNFTRERSTFDAISEAITEIMLGKPYSNIAKNDLVS